MPRSEASRDWREILWDLRVLWLVIAILVFLELATRPFLPPDKPGSLAPLRAHAGKPERESVLLLGSSRFRKVRPDRVAAASGVQASVAVLAFNGGGLDGQRAAVERYLPPEVLADTELLLIGVSPIDTDDGYLNPVVASRIWGWGDFLRHIGAQGLDARTTSFLFAHYPLGVSVLARGDVTTLARIQLRGIGMRLMASLGLMDAPEPAAARDPGSASEVMGSDARRAKQGIEGLDEIAPPQGMLRDYRVGGRQIDALRGLVEELDANGVAVGLVHAPDSEWFRGGYSPGVEARYLAALREVGADLDLAVFVMGARGHGLDDRDFFRRDGTYDGYHLATEEGLDSFSVSLGRQVVGPMLRELRAGRRPGFDLSRFELGP